MLRRSAIYWSNNIANVKRLSQHMLKFLNTIFLSLIILCILGVWGLVTFFSLTRETLTPDDEYSTYCVATKNETLATLKGITKCQVVKGKSIFFHETSCESYKKKKITINSRQACSVESAARAHPDSDVYLLYSSPGTIKFEGDESDRFLKALLSYQNVKIMHLNHETYVKGTPVEKLFTEEIVDNSTYKTVHIADILRFVTMHKYGGIYLDLNVIVLKNLWKLVPNFSAIDTGVSVATAVMRFTPDGVGLEVADECLCEMRDTFNGTLWGYNGPYMMERVLIRRCKKARDAQDLSELESCAGFKIYPRHHFYKYNWVQRSWLFDNVTQKEYQDAIRESEAVHLWNRNTAKVKAPKGHETFIIMLAQQYCPKVYSEVDEYF